MSEYQYDFIKNNEELFSTYRNFPLPVVICNKSWKVYFSNDLANTYYPKATTNEGLETILAEFDRDKLLSEALETGNCTIREIFPPSSVNLSITPIKEVGELSGMILMFVRMDNYIDSKVFYQGTRMAGALADSIRDVVGEVFSQLDSVRERVEGQGDGQILGGIEGVAAQGYRILRIATNISEYSRYQSGLLNLCPEDTDLCALLESAGDVAASIAGRMGTALRFHLPGRKLYVPLDRARFETAFFNILHNALFYAGEGNEVDVTLKRSPKIDGISLSVTDKGLGIPAEVLPDVTRPYYIHQHGTAYRGVGLGLSIARLAADAHDGELQIRSKEGTGTTVTLLLPAAKKTGRVLLEQSAAPEGYVGRFSPACLGLMDASLSPYARKRRSGTGNAGSGRAPRVIEIDPRR